MGGAQAAALNALLSLPLLNVAVLRPRHGASRSHSLPGPASPPTTPNHVQRTHHSTHTQHLSMTDHPKTCADNLSCASLRPRPCALRSPTPNTSTSRLITPKPVQRTHHSTHRHWRRLPHQPPPQNLCNEHIIPPTDTGGACLTTHHPKTCAAFFPTLFFALGGRGKTLHRGPGVW